jgi:hypothetical protein
MTLPLLPVQDVERAYQELNEQIPVELEPLFEYFEGWLLGSPPRDIFSSLFFHFSFLSFSLNVISSLISHHLCCLYSFSLLLSLM